MILNSFKVIRHRDRSEYLQSMTSFITDPTTFVTMQEYFPSPSLYGGLRIRQLSCKLPPANLSHFISSGWPFLLHVIL